MMKAANFPAIYHNILKYEQNLSFTWPWVCHLFVRCGACWFAIAHHSVYSIIDRYLPYRSILFAALLHIVTFCAFFCAGFTLLYCVFIQCHLPAFSFYTSYPEEVYLNKWAKRQLNNKNNLQRRTKLFAGKIVLLALKSKDLAQKKFLAGYATAGQHSLSTSTEHSIDCGVVWMRPHLVHSPHAWNPISASTEVDWIVSRAS